MSAVSYSQAGSQAGHSQGVIFIHACPNALAPHLEWAITKVLSTEGTYVMGAPTRCPWSTPESNNLVG